MSYVTELFKLDYTQEKKELFKEMMPVCDALFKAQEGTHEYEILTLKKESLEIQYELLDKLEMMQRHYNFVKSHAEQMVRYFNGS